MCHIPVKKKKMIAGNQVVAAIEVRRGWIETGYIFQVMMTLYADECVWGIKDDSKSLDLGNRKAKMEMILEIVEPTGRADLGINIRKSVLGILVLTYLWEILSRQNN